MEALAPYGSALKCYETESRCCSTSEIITHLNNIRRSLTIDDDLHLQRYARHDSLISGINFDWRYHSGFVSFPMSSEYLICESGITVKENTKRKIKFPAPCDDHPFLERSSIRSDRAYLIWDERDNYSKVRRGLAHSTILRICYFGCLAIDKNHEIRTQASRLSISTTLASL